MLPVVDKPLIQYAVEEAVAAGITDMIFITGRNKRAIEDHFDKAYEVESRTRGARQARVAANWCRTSFRRHVNCIYIRQPRRWAWGTPCCAPSRWSAMSRSR